MVWSSWRTPLAPAACFVFLLLSFCSAFFLICFLSSYFLFTGSLWSWGQTIMHDQMVLIPGRSITGIDVSASILSKANSNSQVFKEIQRKWRDSVLQRNGSTRKGGVEISALFFKWFLNSPRILLFFFFFPSDLVLLDRESAKDFFFA